MSTSYCFSSTLPMGYGAGLCLVLYVVCYHGSTAGFEKEFGFSRLHEAGYEIPMFYKLTAMHVGRFVEKWRSAPVRYSLIRLRPAGAPN